MATIRATCGVCGDVELTTADVTLRVCADNGTGTYSFRCPCCTMAVVKPADTRTVDLLAVSGVPILTWRLPAELFEPHAGPAVTHDDLLDFHQLLLSEDWFDTLASMVR